MASSFGNHPTPVHCNEVTHNGNDTSCESSGKDLVLSFPPIPALKCRQYKQTRNPFPYSPSQIHFWAGLPTPSYGQQIFSLLDPILRWYTTLDPVELPGWISDVAVKYLLNCI